MNADEAWAQIRGRSTLFASNLFGAVPVATSRSGAGPRKDFHRRSVNNGATGGDHAVDAWRTEAQTLENRRGQVAGSGDPRGTGERRVVLVLLVLSAC